MGGFAVTGKIDVKVLYANPPAVFFQNRCHSKCRMCAAYVFSGKVNHGQNKILVLVKCSVQIKLRKKFKRIKR